MSQPPEVTAEDRPGRMQAAPAEKQAQQGAPKGRLGVALGVLGVCYGDLGTSALYALQAVFNGGREPLVHSSVNVLGVLSLVFWTLLVIVSLK